MAGSSAEQARLARRGSGTASSSRRRPSIPRDAPGRAGRRDPGSARSANRPASQRGRIEGGRVPADRASSDAARRWDATEVRPPPEGRAPPPRLRSKRPPRAAPARTSGARTMRATAGRSDPGGRDPVPRLRRRRPDRADRVASVRVRRRRDRRVREHPSAGRVDGPIPVRPVGLGDSSAGPGNRPEAARERRTVRALGRRVRELHRGRARLRSSLHGTGARLPAPVVRHDRPAIAVPVPAADRRPRE